MGFPAVIAEVAFDNDINEYLYAQAGYSDVTKFVKDISGDLRGRRYEMDRVETGSLSITFDNGDGRFTPHKADSPYYPNVRPARRFRLRGKNMQRLNIATAGSTLRSVRGFTLSDGTYTAIANSPVLVEGGSSVSRTLAHTNDIEDPNTTATTDWADTGGTLSIVDEKLRLTADGTTPPTVYPSAIIAATVNDNVAVSVTVIGDDVENNYAQLEIQAYNGSNAEIAGGATGAWTLIPAGETVVVSLVDTLTGATTAGYRPILTMAGTDSGGNVVAGEYFDTYRWFAEHGSTAVTDTADIVFFSGDDDDALDSAALTHEYAWTGTADSSTSTDYTHAVGVGTHHIEVTVPSGLTGGTEYGIMEFNVPVEIGRRLAHTAYVWKVSGTRAAGTTRLVVRYFDSDGAVIADIDPSEDWSTEQTTPTRRFVAHTCPVTTAYAMAFLTYTPTSGPTADSFVMGVDLVQSENCPNLAANPEAAVDAYYWYVTGENDTEAAVDAEGVKATFVTGDVEFATFIGGLIPGDTYTAYIETYFNPAGAAVNVQVSTDDGLTSLLMSGVDEWNTGSYTFVAQQPTQLLTITKVDGSAYATGDVITVRNFNVQAGSSDPGAYAAGAGDDYTDWEFPMPIFEGWIESWPIRAEAGGANEMRVVANDRLRRLGGITLENTWREAVFADGMQIVLPLDDDPTDAGGAVAQIGTWASSDQFIEVPFVATRGDIGTSTYALGVDGPTDNTALELNPNAASTVGYFLPIPYSNDYTPPPPPPAPKPKPPTTPKPPPRAPTYTYKTYVKTYYATWSRSYDGDGSTTWDDSPYMFQGYYDGNRGSTRSLAGFNYLAIKSDLAGSTIKSCKFSLFNHDTYAFGGGYAFWGTHTYSSKPSTWSTTYVAERRGYSAVAYGKRYTREMGVTVGNEFKAGTTKGMALGPAPSTSRTYYGHWYGATYSAYYRPYITITFVKRIRVS